MLIRTVYEDLTRQAYYELRYLEKSAGHKAGYYLVNIDNDDDRREGFYLPPGEPKEIAKIRARESARFDGLRLTKIPGEEPVK